MYTHTYLQVYCMYIHCYSTVPTVVVLLETIQRLPMTDSQNLVEGHQRQRVYSQRSQRVFLGKLEAVHYHHWDYSLPTAAVFHEQETVFAFSRPACAAGWTAAPLAARQPQEMRPVLSSVPLSLPLCSAVDRPQIPIDWLHLEAGHGYAPVMMLLMKWMVWSESGCWRVLGR